MNVLVVGGGSREHALARALRRSPLVTDLVAVPGSDAMALETRAIAVQIHDHAGIVRVAREAAIELAVIGPEAPLVAGLADALRDAGVAVFGPGASGAQLEGSKIFSKRFMRRHAIPTAAFEVFDDPARAEDYVRSCARPLVVKADGLAAGKGVVVASSTDEALAAVDAMMRRREFGEAGARVLIEEVLRGEELSLHIVSDGTRWIDLGVAQDHKRIGDGDRGPNTGGMGAYAPVAAWSASLAERTRREIVEPTIAGLAAEGLPFRGVLFIGLMVDGGRASVLEYNVRFGDPECAVLMMRLEGDVAPLLLGAARGQLDTGTVRVRDESAIAVVMAARGYPGVPIAGDEIRGIETASAIDGVAVLHAGTRRDGARWVTAGGRVLTVTARGSDLDDAARRAYAAVDAIRFDGAQVRRDIGWRGRTPA